uniref:Uncharacterized protein n=1 Tax=Pelusios castaneus TaxID=367368 RepID=A0A8C8R683_9SAUR
MEKCPSREIPRRLLAKLGKMDMKRLAHHFSMAAAEFDKESGFSGKQFITPAVLDCSAIF